MVAMKPNYPMNAKPPVIYFAGYSAVFAAAEDTIPAPEIS